MTLIRLDFIKGRSDEQIATLVDATRRFMMSTLQSPWRDCSYVVGQHASLQFTTQLTCLTIEPAERVIMVTIPDKPQSDNWQLLFYEELCQALQESCDIDPRDVIINIDTRSNTD